MTEENFCGILRLTKAKWNLKWIMIISEKNLFLPKVFQQADYL